MMPGENAPPMHPCCHCSTAAYIDDKAYDEWIQSYPEHHMPFKEWKDKNYSEGVKFSGSNFANTKSKTKKELLTMTKLGDKIISRHTDIKSKWSGNVNRLVRNGLNFSGKEWNCDISLLDDAATHQAVHELLHARSISYYDKKTYKSNRALEELSVEFFTKEILKSEGIAQIPSSAYGLSVKRLSIINQRAGVFDTDYEFAKALFETPLIEREKWLRDKIFDGSDTIAEYNKTIKYLEKVLKWR